ncbi:Dihydrolipoamide dehydrogenase of pyruvate dehydrogenase complex [Hyphomicrobium sulfonivorans]|uniref:Dihydrolipoyl dehydrogenase n=1 Tax=Hyphomicrobium sulfonivorans TaxID=121290 RepID=A0A120CWF0_HYPSL|nr:dihydrolipoyl dehydrogenase [Hyphomicrobium sulfonivorans]KWT69314.1 Dihydrolipoamide dehydrogenase of pyruvate dehydrogenase complex [Hyphomicrobium sulfonivorans]
MVRAVDIEADIVVLGAGPGGYTAAFRAADLGKKVVVVERGPALGGVCLNVGCIPSKALLHAAKVLEDADEMTEAGLGFTRPQLDLDKLRRWKSGIVSKLTGGLAALARQRKVIVVTGFGRFVSPNEIEVTHEGATKRVAFTQAIIAAGSEPARLPIAPKHDSRILDSTGALDLQDVPPRLLVVGGGIIGLEMATVYHALGSRVTVVEAMDQLISGADRDIVAPLMKRISTRYDAVHLGTKVRNIASAAAELTVTFEGANAPEEQSFDKILVAVGRVPNSGTLGLAAAGVAVDQRGFIRVDKQMRTNVPHIFAIGDVVGQPMLAHKAVHEGKVAAEVAAGLKAAFDARVIPSVAYTDPEVAWVGLTEAEANANGVAYGKGSFPWEASGRALSQGRSEGLTKVLFDPETHRTLGCGIVGAHAGELIGEMVLAIEMGADAADIAGTIHPHPTLSETIAQSAEMFEGTITDLIARQARQR